jgi:hypothetical protein
MWFEATPEIPTSNMSNILRQTNLPCGLHKYHRPEPFYNEMHHVIPQAWQKAWKPRGHVLVLWYPVTEVICPTGHRGVHYILSSFMKYLAQIGQNDTLSRQFRTVIELLRHKGYVVPNNEQDMAYEAVKRWVEFGGSIDFLTEAKLWGEA